MSETTSVRVTMEEGGRDVWHDAPCRGPMKHLPDRLPIGDGVVLRLYECTACDARVFAGGDKQGRIVYRPAPSPPGEPAGEPIPDTFTADTRRGDVDRNGPESNTSEGEPTTQHREGEWGDCDDGFRPASPAPVAGGEPTKPPKDWERLNWLDECGVESIIFRDGSQLNPASMNIRAAIDAHHREAIYDVID